MKVERQEVGFQPVTITLESQAELDAVVIGLGELSCEKVMKFDDFNFDTTRKEAVVSVLDCMCDKLVDLY